MTEKSKKSVSQWVGVILALGASPLMFTISMILGPTLTGSDGWGLVLAILILCLGIYLFALLVSKIIYFIIK